MDCKMWSLAIVLLVFMLTPCKTIGADFGVKIIQDRIVQYYSSQKFLDKLDPNLRFIWSMCNTCFGVRCNFIFHYNIFYKRVTPWASAFSANQKGQRLSLPPSLRCPLRWCDCLVLLRRLIFLFLFLQFDYSQLKTCYLKPTIEKVILINSRCMPMG